MEHDDVVDDLIRSSLRLNDDWQIDQLLFDEQTPRVDVYLSHSDEMLVCPETGEAGTLYDHRTSRSWQHLNLLQFPYFVHCRSPLRG